MISTAVSQTKDVASQSTEDCKFIEFPQKLRHAAKNAGKSMLYADVVRGVAVFLVVLIHSAAKIMIQWDKIPLDHWLWGNGFDAVSRASVPLFVMLSGALMLGRQEAAGDFFKKRLSKLMIPFSFWVAAYINWRIFYIGEVLPVDKLIISIVTGPVYYHLWYLYMVMGLYLITPLLRSLLPHMGKRDLRYAFGLWVTWNSLLPLLFYIIWLYVGYSVNLGIKVPLAMGYSGYFILGWYLTQKKTNENAMWKWLAAFLLSTCAIFFGTWLFTDAAGAFQDILYDYFSPAVLAQAVSLFMLLRCYGDRMEMRIGHSGRRWWAMAGRFSFGIYLAHVMLLELFEGGGLGFELHGTSFHPGLAVPVTAVVIFVLSWLAVALISRIPILCYVVTEPKRRKS